MMASTLTTVRGLIMLNMSTLDERIATLMEATGWTVGEIASIAGVTSSAVSQWLGKTGDSGKATKSIKIEPALLLERKSGFSALWLSKGIGPQRVVPAQAPADLSASLRMVADMLSSLPRVKREGVKAYLAHLIEHCDNTEEVNDAISLIRSAIETKQLAA